MDERQKSSHEIEILIKRQQDGGRLVVPVAYLIGGIVTGLIIGAVVLLVASQL